MSSKAYRAVTAIAFAAAVVFPGATFGAQHMVSIASGCQNEPGHALAAVADALTSGSDATVLEAALRARNRLRLCGLARDAVSAQLIAADAYGDVKQARNRCSALSDARAHSLALHDRERAALIGRALSGC